ncbi:6-phosphogluconate dehydrogenase protein [Paenibacillus algicola]|uniref:6-phosphogluconate dehydrogenase protein n=1 Tax=Paenibacillus algicola TaxID=2565926 RepID=A0A4P8XHB8_9BACL|nr:NAD(P)-dependent oxidoreductase [Paenibacillus algicola]QCT01708.1 6-phosphogluconate dehydrogenase protein [Paenibacillus algicola]
MVISPGQASVGFIGLGVMGHSMAGHILAGGYDLHVYTRTASKAEELTGRGAVWQETPAKLAQACDIILTMVGYPQDVEELYLGEDGLIANARHGAYLLDMTTSSPALARRIGEAADKRGLHALDAPVSGGDIGAREGRLSIMIGGEAEDVEVLRPILSLMGRQIVHQGPAGAGQHTKMCNQIAIASNMMGVCEAMAYAESAGLDPQTVLKSIESGAAGSWSLSNLAPRIIAGDLAPGFYIKHFIKDMGIALESAKEMNVSTPGLSLAEALYRQLAEKGYQDQGTQALIRYYSSM